MRRVLVACLMVLASAGCGQTDTDIGREAAAILGPEVAAIRSAAEGQNSSQAAQRLRDLRQSVAELTRTGKLSQDAARKILDAAGEVEANLHLIPTRQSPPLRRQTPAKAPEPSPAVTPPTPTAPPPPTDQPSPIGPSPEEKGRSGEGGQDGGEDSDEEQDGNQSQSESSGENAADGVPVIGAAEDVD